MSGEAIVENTTIIGNSRPQKPLHCDYEGNPSLKRIFGSIFVCSGLVMVSIAFVFSLLHPGVGYDSAITLSSYVCAFGLGFFGLTVPERFANRRD